MSAQMIITPEAVALTPAQRHAVRYESHGDAYLVRCACGWRRLVVGSRRQAGNVFLEHKREATR